MKPISRLRFDALGGYARQPRSILYGEEIRFFEHANERLLGMIIRDLTDNDFGGMVLGRDRRLRFRWVSGTGFFDSQRRAEVELRREMERVAGLPDDEYYQGDETGKPVDFFTPVVPTNRLNPNFLTLRDQEGFSAAKWIIEEMMRWYEDIDGNFIEQFQTTGFDARIWELYLFAAFREMLYWIDRSHPAPDFLCENPGARFYVEAVTVNPTRDKIGAIVPEPEINTQEDFDQYRLQYMPIKFGSPLTSKLARRYWELPHVADTPLLFAIQDFSALRSMVRSRSAFEIYIYGYVHDWERDADDKLKIIPRKVETHQWGAKEIPSGFFDLPDAENVAAVIFSNSGTISKFNRMGFLAGFGSPRLRLERVGFAVNLDPNATDPVQFHHSINDPDYKELWSEGLDVWHNPRAKYPLDHEAVPFAAHHWLHHDGQVESLTPDWHPLGSMTLQTLVDPPETA
jgi:hypothetical protein